MELVQVLDDNADPTGEVLDKEEVHKRNLLHNEIVVFVVNSKKQVILQKRAATKKLAPNKWALPAGHVQAGETVKQCAVRELEEEMGMKLTEADLKPIQEKVIARHEYHSHVMYFYYVECDWKEEDFVVQEEELSCVKWWDIDEVIARQDAGDKDILYEKQVHDLFVELNEKLSAKA